MEKYKLKHLDKSALTEQIVQAKYGDHNLILCSEQTGLESIYLNCSKISLGPLNEIVLILPHYHSVGDVLNNLASNDIEVNKYKKEGAIVVVESKKAHYGLTQRFVGAMIMTKMLTRREDKLGKAGVTVISDMSLFFDIDKIEDISIYEIDILHSISNLKVKALCVYNKSDFEFHIERQKQEHFLDLHTNKGIFFPN